MVYGQPTYRKQGFTCPVPERAKSCDLGDYIHLCFPEISHFKNNDCVLFVIMV